MTDKQLIAAIDTAILDVLCDPSNRVRLKQAVRVVSILGLRFKCEAVK